MTSYVEGPWLALVTPRSVAMLADAPLASLATLADALSERGLAGFIDALTEATGTTASSLPEFAVAIAEEHGIRVAVRGGSTLTDASGDGSTVVTGVGVTGWAESVWEKSAAVDIVSPESPRGGELWILEGAVRAASVRWSPSAQRSKPTPGSETISASPLTPRSSPVVPPPPDTDVVPVPRAQESSPTEQGEASGAADRHDAAGRNDEISLETLAPAYDTEGDPQEEASHDAEFGSLWGSTVSSPATVRSGGDPLISSLPEFTSPPVTPPSEEPVASAPSAPPGSAVPVPSPAAQPRVPSPAQAPGDHDGATVSIAALRAMTSGQPPLTGDGAPVPSFATAEQLVKERRGRAVMSNGAVVTLDKSVIVGRAPKASRVTGEMPHLVTVPSPTQDISRSHVELRVEGTAVVAVDLNTTNGTVVRRHGAEPVRLHPGEPHVLLTGDVIDIGDGVTITLEDLP